MSRARVLAIVVVLVAVYVLLPRATPRPGHRPVEAPVSPSQQVALVTDDGRTGAPPSGLRLELAQPAETAAPQPTGGIGEPASYCKPQFCAKPQPRIVDGPQLAGSSTWYAWHPGEAAAGPGLRRWLGPDWRGTVITVIAPGCGCKPIAVRLTDWCLCRDDRIVDLDAASFAKLSPLDRGIIRVIVMEGDWTQ